FRQLGLQVRLQMLVRCHIDAIQTRRVAYLPRSELHVDLGRTYKGHSNLKWEGPVTASCGEKTAPTRGHSEGRVLRMQVQGCGSGDRVFIRGIVVLIVYSKTGPALRYNGAGGLICVVEKHPWAEPETVLRTGTRRVSLRRRQDSVAAKW